MTVSVKVQNPNPTDYFLRIRQKNPSTREYGPDTLITDGSEHTFYAYEERAIEVYEVKKSKST